MNSKKMDIIKYQVALPYYNTFTLKINFNLLMKELQKVAQYLFTLQQKGLDVLGIKQCWYS